MRFNGLLKDEVLDRLILPITGVHAPARAILLRVAKRDAEQDLKLRVFYEWAAAASVDYLAVHLLQGSYRVEGFGDMFGSWWTQNVPNAGCFDAGVPRAAEFIQQRP